MNKFRFISLLTVFISISVDVSAVEISQCEDEAGNRVFQQICPPGSTLINKKYYSSKGSNATPVEKETVQVVLYMKPNCAVCDRVKEVLTT